MEKENLLFYNEYEEFYEMAEKSTAFQIFCYDAFGQKNPAQMHHNKISEMQ